MLAGTSTDDADYDRIRSSDLISIVNLGGLAPGRPLTMKVTPIDGRKAWETSLKHTLTQEQIEYFKAGSALNLMARGG